MTTIIFLLFGAALGAAGGYVYRKKQIEAQNKDLVEKSEKMVNDAKNKARELVLEARSEALKLQDEMKREDRKRQDQLGQMEERVLKKEEQLDKKHEDADKLRTELEQKLHSVKEMREELEGLHKLQSKELERVAAMSKEDAKNLLLAKVEEESKTEIIAQIKKTEAELQNTAKEKAKMILADAIARCAAETTSESTSTIVNLPSDDLKGRIIGREGRNINTFEHITGVDVIVDDTPGSIVLAGFDLVRRYVAKVALERLIEDGRIHPARIEETVEKVKEDVNLLIKELGEKAAMDTGVTGLHPNLVKILGRLKFRIAAGQNVLKQSMEISFLSANLAAELGADVSVCKRAGLLHAIGKAVDHEIPGSYAKIGADIARKFGLPQEVVQAIEAHDGNVEAPSLEAQIVQTAVLISHSRPGAEKENLDSYVKRLMELENLCMSFEGVKKAFAVQAGSEVRIFVDPEVVDDLKAIKLSRAIAKKIEHDMQHPGVVKVHVVREVRAEDYAE